MDISVFVVSGREEKVFVKWNLDVDDGKLNQIPYKNMFVVLEHVRRSIGNRKSTNLLQKNSGASEKPIKYN